MSGLEFGTVLSVIELCISLGEFVLQRYQNFKDAQASVTQTIVKFENIWFKAHLQLAFVQDIWNSLSPAHQSLYGRITSVLNEKLRFSINTIERVSKKNKGGLGGIVVNRWRYTWLKDAVDASIQDFAEWQQVFDPSWFMLMRLVEPRIDQQLQANIHSGDQRRVNAFKSSLDLRIALKAESEVNRAKIFLPADKLIIAREYPVPLSSLKMVQRSGSQRWLLFETINQLSHFGQVSFYDDVRDIARKLHYCDALEFRLLNCYGVIRDFNGSTHDRTSCTILYNVPDGLGQPQSLRDLLCKGGTAHPLSERFQIAKDLVKAVSSVHNFGFVHKNIRPEVVMMLNDGSLKLGTPFLAGFEAFRNAEGRTMRLGDTLWYRNLYRHPERQGPRPSEDFVMQHDIYSLGVCLLEVGLVQSLVKYGVHGLPESPAPVLGLTVQDFSILRADKIKERLVDVAKTELPRHMGNRYTEIVLQCMQCLDDDNVDFGDAEEFRDSEGIVISVRYIEKILLRLNELCV